MKLYKIYKLIHNGNIVYVGRTINSFTRRRGTGYKYNKDVDNIIKECTYELIEETEDSTRERYWIEHFRSIGIKLLNKQSGDIADYTEYYRQCYPANKKWKKDNPEYMKEYLKEYREKNKESIKKDQEEYRNREENKVKMKEYLKKYYQEKVKKKK